MFEKYTVKKPQSLSMFSFRHAHGQKEKQIIQIAYHKIAPVHFHFCFFVILICCFFSSYEIICYEIRDKRTFDHTLFTYIETMTFKSTVSKYSLIKHLFKTFFQENTFAATLKIHYI